MGEAKFKLGEVVATKALANTIQEDNKARAELEQAIKDHATGNWGELGEEDKEANELALQYGERILSKYSFGWGSIYIITEADRSYTTCMFCEEY